MTNTQVECAYKIRSAVPSDVDYIYSSWAKSFRLNSGLGKSVRKSIYFREFHALIDHILDHSQVLVASDDTDLAIFGYIVFELPNIIHYVFVKESFQGFGLAKKLIKQAMPKESKYLSTHWTKAANDLLYGSDIIDHNPFLLFKKGT